MNDTPSPSFSEKVARAVKAELARRGLDATALMEPLRLSRNTVYSRLKNETQFDTSELEAACVVIGIDLSVLMASAALEDMPGFDRVAQASKPSPPAHAELSAA